MIIRYLFNIIMLFAFAYGAYGVLNYSNAQLMGEHWQYYLYLVSPWALLYGSLKAWHRCFVWRRMLEHRQTPPILSRGKHSIHKTTTRPSILEHGSFLLLVLAVAAILKQFSVSHIAWWIGSLLGAWFALRLMLKNSR